MNWGRHMVQRFWSIEQSRAEHLERVENAKSELEQLQGIKGIRTVLSLIHLMPRKTVEFIIECAIDRLDLSDGDPDLEDNHDAEDDRRLM